MFNTEELDGVTVVTIGGDLHGARSQKTKETLLAIIEDGHHNIVVDLGSALFVDSAGLGALVSAIKTLRAAGGDLRICCAVPQVVTIFELTRLTKLMQLFPDRQSAVASFSEAE